MLFCRSCVRAAVTDDALVVRVTGKTPRLWKAPLAELAHATLSISTHEEDKKTVWRLLVDKTGGIDEIARFDDAKSAERAFVTVSDRLLDGVSGARAAKRPLIVRLLLALAKVLLWFLFLFMIMAVVSMLFLKSRGIDPGVVQPEKAAVTKEVKPAAPAEGVAVPADQLFGQ